MDARKKGHKLTGEILPNDINIADEENARGSNQHLTSCSDQEPPGADKADNAVLEAATFHDRKIRKMPA